jgi:hypothetical protein
MIQEITSSPDAQDTSSDVSEGYLQAKSVMKDAVAFPPDRRRAERRWSHRRSQRLYNGNESRARYRRTYFDRRGFQMFLKTKSQPETVMEYLKRFDKNWTLPWLNTLTVKSSVLGKQKWSLHWQARLDDFPISWWTLAYQLNNSLSIVFESLGGDVEIFRGRLWVEPYPGGSKINLNWAAAFGLGSFERLFGNIFKQKCNKIFQSLAAKWKNELDDLP